MRSIAIPPILVAPKTVATTILVLVCLALVIEVADYQWFQGESLNQVDRSLNEQLGTLHAVASLAKEQNLSHDAINYYLDRYCSRVRIDALVELVENDSVIYRSSNLNPTISSRSHDTKGSTGENTVLAFSLQSLRVFSKVEGTYRFTVSRSLSEVESSKELHSVFSWSVIALLLLLAPSSLILGLYWHRPTRALRKHIESLFKQSRHLPLPPIPEFSHLATDELVHRIHSIIRDLHSSRTDALTFSSMASHEMRTPLSLIRNSLEAALTSRDTDPSVQKVITSVYDEILRLNGTVEDLLNLSTPQTGTANLNFTYFALRDFLKTFYDEALFLTRPKDITVVLAKGPAVTIEADAVRLRQVFFNLLDNAIKNTESQGRIHIASEARGDEILLTFSDTGRGISSENLPRIFEPFFKDTSGEAPTRGVGLGLPLVKWIIESHNGSVAVKSEPGKGTTFFVRIPRYHSTPI